MLILFELILFGRVPILFEHGPILSQHTLTLCEHMHRAIHVNGFQPRVDMSEHIIKATSPSHFLYTCTCV